MENGGFLCKSFFLVDPSPLGVLFFFFLEESEVLYLQVLHGHACWPFLLYSL